MEIKKLDELTSLLSAENPPVIDTVDCEVSVFELAKNDCVKALEDIAKAIELAGQLEMKYCNANPDRKSKLNPHQAIAVVIRGINSTESLPGYESGMNNLYFSLEKLCEIVSVKGIWLLIENPSEKLLFSPLELRELIDNLSCPWLGILFNENNVPTSSNIDDWIKILGKRIRIFMK